MPHDKLRLWLTSQSRVAMLTGVGTLVCIGVALAFDSYSPAEGWRWGARPWNNVIIPLLLAPPLFYFLLSQMRQLSIAYGRLEAIASTDSLTSCLNRAAFATLVEAYLERFATSPERNQGAMLIIDVDHFKRINDEFGHDRGDEALTLVASSIRAVLRNVDIIGRLGGEEFSVFLPGASVEHCARLGDRIRQAVGELEFRPTGEPYPITVSVGAAPFSSATTFSELYRVADQHLYLAKKTGRNRVVVAPSLAPPSARLN